MLHRGAQGSPPHPPEHGSGWDAEEERTRYDCKSSKVKTSLEIVALHLAQSLGVQSVSPLRGGARPSPRASHLMGTILGKLGSLQVWSPDSTCRSAPSISASALSEVTLE